MSHIRFNGLTVDLDKVLGGKVEIRRRDYSYRGILASVTNSGGAVVLRLRHSVAREFGQGAWHRTLSSFRCRTNLDHYHQQDWIAEESCYLLVCFCCGEQVQLYARGKGPEWSDMPELIRPKEVELITT